MPKPPSIIAQVAGSGTALVTTLVLYATSSITQKPACPRIVTRSIGVSQPSARCPPNELSVAVADRVPSRAPARKKDKVSAAFLPANRTLSNNTGAAKSNVDEAITPGSNFA
jgi:hypothetical protein